MSNRRTVSFERCSADNETAKALLVYVPDLGGSVWIPKSMIHDDSEVYGMADEGDLVVQEWFAVKRGVGVMCDEATATFEDCIVVLETAGVLLVHMPEIDWPVWIPESVIVDDSEVHGYSDEGKLVIQKWYAIEQGWV